MNKGSLIAALAAMLIVPAAQAGEIYMCEIVDGDSSQLVAAANLDLQIAGKYHLVTHTDEATHMIDVKLTLPASRLNPPRIVFGATIEEGANARPILLPLGPLTLDCRNQNPDALTWSLRALRLANKANGGLGEKVDEDVIGLKHSVSVNPAAGAAAQVPETSSKTSAQ